MKIVDTHSFNKFDVYLFLLVLSLLGGQLGGSFQLPRLLAICLSPIVFKRFNDPLCSIVKPFYIFFVLWLLYGVLSLIWTPDIEEGIKEVFYYIVHPLLFLEIIMFSHLAKKAIRTISFAWVFALFVTFPVDFWELITNKHLPTSTVKGEMFMMAGGVQILHPNASFTFGNYNNFNVFISMCLPFLFYRLSLTNKTKREWLFLILSFISVYVIVLINASRGAVLVSSIVLIIFALHSFSFKKKSGMITLLVLLCVIIYACVVYGDVLFEIIMIRGGSGEEMFKDGARSNLMLRGMTILIDTYGFGCGMGGIISAMTTYNTSGGSTTSPHNLFVELFAQYGFVIGLCFIYFIIKIAKWGFTVKNNSLKILLRSALLSMPFMCVINSGYLLSPHTWVYFACLFIISRQSWLFEKQKGYRNHEYIGFV